MQTSSSTDTSLDIVLVTWNSARTMERCLMALQKHRSKNTSLIVVDNASQDSTVELIKSQTGGKATVIAHAVNRGFAAACNAGARAGCSPFILFLNPDCEIQAGSVEALLALLETNANIAVVGGKLIGYDGLPQRGFAVRSLPRPIDFWLEALGINQVFPHNPWNQRYRLSRFDFEHDAAVEQPAGACFMIRRSVFEELSGFDERFHPAWFEDVDLCQRLRSANRSLYFCAQAKVVHGGGSSIHAMAAGQAAELFFVNMVRYSRKHFGRAATALLRFALALGMGLRWIATVTHSQSVERFRDGSAGEKSVRQIRRELRRAYLQILRGAMGQWRP